MDSVELLMTKINQEFPSLVIELTGPWPSRPHPQKPKGEIDRPWIVNFKDYEYLLAQTHAGSSGVTPADALLEGLIWLRMNKGNF